MASLMLKIAECFRNLPTFSCPISRMSFTRYFRIFRLEDETIILSLTLYWIDLNDYIRSSGILNYDELLINWSVIYNNYY